MFVDEEKLRRLSDIYNAFSQSNAQELTKLKERMDKYSIMQEIEPLALPTFTRSIIKSNSRPISPRPASPLCIPNFELVNNDPRRTCDSPVPSPYSSESNLELRSKSAMVEEFRTRLDKIETDAQQVILVTF